MPRKTPLKTYYEKKKVTKMHFLWFAFLKFSKREMFFQKQDFYIWMKGKNRPGNI